MTPMEELTKGLAKLGYPGIAKLVEERYVFGSNVCRGIIKLYWDSHTEEEQKLIKHLLNVSEYNEI